MMRQAIWLMVALILERAFGVSYLLLPLVSAMLFLIPDDEKPGMMFAVGLIADMFMGRGFGISSLLFLLSALEVSAYGVRFESDNFWSVFLAGVLMSAQASLFWQQDIQMSMHALHGVIAVGFWMISAWWAGRGYGKDLYLRK